MTNPSPTLYREYEILFDPPTCIPWSAARHVAWSFTHKDYDLDDPRQGRAASLQEAMQAIDEIEDELAQTAPSLPGQATSS